MLYGSVDHRGTLARSSQVGKSPGKGLCGQGQGHCPAKGAVDQEPDEMFP